MFASLARIAEGGRAVDYPATQLLYQECRVGISRQSNRDCSQSRTSSSTHPTLFGPSCTRLGNWPAFSKRATCCGEYKTNSFSWRFESILITMSP